MKINLFVFICMVLLKGAGCSSTARKENYPDQNRLIGEWVRMDGDYELRILCATSDGKLDAGYFNPDTINVG